MIFKSVFPFVFLSVVPLRSCYHVRQAVSLQFVYFCPFVYFETLKKKTLIDTYKISEEIFQKLLTNYWKICHKVEGNPYVLYLNLIKHDATLMEMGFLKIVSPNTRICVFWAIFKKLSISRKTSFANKIFVNYRWVLQYFSWRWSNISGPVHSIRLCWSFWCLRQPWSSSFLKNRTPAHFSFTSDKTMQEMSTGKYVARLNTSNYQLILVLIVTRVLMSANGSTIRVMWILVGVGARGVILCQPYYLLIPFSAKLSL